VALDAAVVRAAHDGRPGSGGAATFASCFAVGLLAIVPATNPRGASARRGVGGWLAAVTASLVRRLQVEAPPRRARSAGGSRRSFRWPAATWRRPSPRSPRIPRRECPAHGIALLIAIALFVGEFVWILATAALADRTLRTPTAGPG
jgi:hypothetical protein